MNHSNDPPSHAPHGTGRRSVRRRIRATSLGVFVCVFGLLIWTKLRLAASIPRTVIAQPSQIDHAAAPDPADDRSNPPPANDSPHASVPELPTIE